LARIAGKPETQRAYCEAVICTGEAHLAGGSGDAELMTILGLAYAQIGNRGKAIEYFDKVQKSRSVTDDTFLSPLLLRRVATGYVVLGEYDLAVNLLRRAVAGPTPVNEHLLTIFPELEPLTEHPGFQELMQSMRR
jgi:tetratricopeptide (TPR) repeat protein